MICGMADLYFSTPSRIAALKAEADSWLGTPFIDGIGRRAKKGTASDCGSWIAATLQAVGAIGAVPWPRAYVSQTGGPEMLETLINTLSAVPRLRCLYLASEDPEAGIPLIPGDLLVGSTGKAHHHMVLYMGENVIYHCWAGKVQVGNLHDSMLAKHMHSIWRATE